MAHISRSEPVASPWSIPPTQNPFIFVSETRPARHLFGAVRQRSLWRKWLKNSLRAALVLFTAAVAMFVGPRCDARCWCCCLCRRCGSCFLPTRSSRVLQTVHVLVRVGTCLLSCMVLLLVSLPGSEARSCHSSSISVFSVCIRSSERDLKGLFCPSLPPTPPPINPARTSFQPFHIRFLRCACPGLTISRVLLEGSAPCP